MQFDRHWIAAHIPHQGDMCLLAGVVDWDADHIVCSASSHRYPQNPLRQGDQLGILAGIEYAAQSMAVHGVLLGLQSSEGQTAPHSTASAPGYLASTREVHWQVERLDDIAADLTVIARRVAGEENARVLLYDFSLTAASLTLLQGRASVMLARSA